MRHPEHDLQRLVVRDVVPILRPGVVFTAVNPLPGRGKLANYQGKQLGVTSGIHDLLFVHDGCSLWIELKAPGGTLSDVQKDLHRRLVEAHRYPNEAYTRSGTVVVCKSLDEVRMALASHRMTMEKAA